MNNSKVEKVKWKKNEPKKIVNDIKFFPFYHRCQYEISDYNNRNHKKAKDKFKNHGAIGIHCDSEIKIVFKMDIFSINKTHADNNKNNQAQ